MSDRFKLFIVGLFVFSALLAVAWLFLFLHPTVGDGGKILRVRFSNIEKVSIGTRVNFSGRPVGEVIEINEIYDARNQPSDPFGNFYFYELVLRVDSSVKIYTYDEIVFSTAGLLGEKSISILPKATPPGCPPPKEITTCILFAQSTDPFADALRQFKKVASSFECTLSKVSCFLDRNTEEMHHAIASFAAASDEIRDFACKANEIDVLGRVAGAADHITVAMTKADSVFHQMIGNDLVGRISVTFDKAGNALDELTQVTTQLSSGQGTLGQLLFSDRLYLQLSGTMSHLETVLGDISRYGLLFQYDKKWQRQQALKVARMCQLSTPCDFYMYFDRELQDISVSFDRVSTALSNAECCNVKLDDPCFAEQFRALLEKVNALQENLNLYHQRLSQEYYQNCY